jgi:hypothetical protein
MKAKSIKGQTAEEIELALENSMADEFKPTLAIVFISINLDRKSICEMLHQRNIDFLGATSSGEFINGYQGESSAVILLMELNREYYTILFEDIGDKDLADAAEQLARDALNKFRKPAFILCSTAVSTRGEYFDGGRLIRCVENAVGFDVSIFGGMAGDDAKFTGTYVFTYDQSADVGVAALILDEEKIDIHGMAISGWKPLGTTKTVTKSEDSWVYTIDGQPALDMYLRYLGEQPASGSGPVKIFEQLGFYYPFLAIDAGDPVIRTPLMVDKEKNAIKLDFHVPEGKKLQFSMPPDFDIVENVLSNANEIKNNTQSEADALLIFSCAGRLSALGPMINAENEGLHDIWKAPMAGFFTYGEYGKDIDGKQKFHSTTCSWVALKEK